MGATNNFPAYSLNNTLMMVDDLNNRSIIKELGDNYTEVFIINEVNVAGRQPLVLSDDTIIVDKLDAVDNSFYSKIKKLLRRKSIAEFWIYKIITNKELHKETNVDDIVQIESD